MEEEFDSGSWVDIIIKRLGGLGVVLKNGWARPDAGPFDELRVNSREGEGKATLCFSSTSLSSRSPSRLAV